MIISGTVTDASGRILSRPDRRRRSGTACATRGRSPIGLNCALGAALMRPYIAGAGADRRRHLRQLLSERRPAQSDERDRLRRDAGDHLGAAERVRRAGFVNIAGGCCGTTPEHIAAIAGASAVRAERRPAFASRRRPADLRRPRTQRFPQGTARSGTGRSLPSEPARIAHSRSDCPASSRVIGGSLFVNIGERTNVTGSKAFARMILAGQFEQALAVARQQVENGAQVIDINMDEAMLD